MSTTTASLAPPSLVVRADPTATSNWTLRILVIATAVSVPLMILSIVNAGALRLVWDNLHWSISATGAALAAGWSVRGASGRARAVRACAAAALTLWALGTVAWAWMNLTGTVTVPSITDLCIVAIVVPGAGVLIASVRGRLTLAEEAAVYLDALLGVLSSDRSSPTSSGRPPSCFRPLRASPRLRTRCCSSGSVAQGSSPSWPSATRSSGAGPSPC